MEVDISYSIVYIYCCRDSRAIPPIAPKHLPLKWVDFYLHPIRADKWFSPNNNMVPRYTPASNLSIVLFSFRRSKFYLVKIELKLFTVFLWFSIIMIEKKNYYLFIWNRSNIFRRFSGIDQKLLRSREFSFYPSTYRREFYTKNSGGNESLF